MKNYWGFAFTISVLFHVAILVKMPTFIKKDFQKETVLTKTKKPKEIKIVPQKIEKIKNEAPIETAEIKPLPYVENIMSKLINGNYFSPLQKPQIFEKNVKEIIFSDLPHLDKELKNNPAYTNYYRLVREKIRVSAYNNYNRKVKGEVIIAFLVSRDGQLKDIELSSYSISSRVLKAIALKSVKQSAPFPAFPTELSKYSQLKFSISIQFKSN